MDDLSDRFHNAVSELEAVTRELNPDEARARFDDTTLQNFWRDWTSVSTWAGALWRALSEDLEMPARPVAESDLDEVGGAG